MHFLFLTTLVKYYANWLIVHSFKSIKIYFSALSSTFLMVWTINWRCYSFFFWNKKTNIQTLTQILYGSTLQLGFFALIRVLLRFNTLFMKATLLQAFHMLNKIVSLLLLCLQVIFRGRVIYIEWLINLNSQTISIDKPNDGQVLDLKKILTQKKKKSK